MLAPPVSAFMMLRKSMARSPRPVRRKQQLSKRTRDEESEHGGRRGRSHEGVDGGGWVFNELAGQRKGEVRRIARITELGGSSPLWGMTSNQAATPRTVWFGWKEKRGSMGSSKVWTSFFYRGAPMDLKLVRAAKLGITGITGRHEL